MTIARSRTGAVLHFPPAGTIEDGVSPIAPPPPEALAAFAAEVAPKALPAFVADLVKAARRRRYQGRWTGVNRARLELARLCLDRMLAEGLDVPAGGAA